MKNVLILESSPRRKGNTAVLADQTSQAIREAGINVDLIHLHGMNIEPCNHCQGCKRQNKNCVIQDDMQFVYPKLVAADGLILASPIYWFNFNAQLKTCIDRWYGTFQNNPDLYKGKPVGLIIAYGGSDLYHSGGINALITFETLTHYLEALSMGCVHGTTNNVGDAEKDIELMEKARQMGQRMADFLLKSES